MGGASRITTRTRREEMFYGKRAKPDANADAEMLRDTQRHIDMDRLLRFFVAREWEEARAILKRFEFRFDYDVVMGVATAEFEWKDFFESGPDGDIIRRLSEKVWNCVPPNMLLVTAMHVARGASRDALVAFLDGWYFGGTTSNFRALSVDFEGREIFLNAAIDTRALKPEAFLDNPDAWESPSFLFSFFMNRVADRERYESMIRSRVVGAATSEDRLYFYRMSKRGRAITDPKTQEEAARRTLLLCKAYGIDPRAFVDILRNVAPYDKPYVDPRAYDPMYFKGTYRQNVDDAQERARVDEERARTQVDVALTQTDLGSRVPMELSEHIVTYLASALHPPAKMQT